MRNLPCAKCGQLDCTTCYPIYGDKNYYQIPGRDHHGTAKRQFIAWDGEGTKVESPMYTITLEKGITRFTDDISPGILRLGSDGVIRPIPGAVPKERLWLEEYVAPQQPYVLLANSVGDHIIQEDGLATADCFELMLDTKQRYPDSIFVGFGFNYDINQILKDLHEDQLWRIHDDNWTRWRGYWIKWLPGKSLTVAQHSTKRSFVVYDVFGFFQSSFLDAARKYLGDDPDLAKVEAGKQSREAFEFSQMNDFILPYCQLELSMLVRIMDILRDDLASVDIYPSLWHGPGAIANVVLKQWSIPISRTVPTEVLDASQYAYAGGRFEHFRLGRYDDTIYEYDIRSAYPAGATHLPDISRGAWEHVERFEPGEFGVWHINYVSDQPGKHIRPQPLFCRSESGLISYPSEVEGWYWTPEAELCPDYVTDGWIFRPETSERPFSFIQEMYEARRLFKLQGNSAERALKLILNSIYGKLAQTVGGKDGPPRWHQLEYAGYITSYTRAKIYRAVQLSPQSIMAIETDALFSNEPLDLPISDKLGDWELKEYDSITYLQSGYYYAVQGEKIICKYRGMDRDRETMQPVGLPYGVVLDHLRNSTGYSDRPTPPLRSTTTRFVGLGLGLRTSATWRAWEKMPKVIQLDQRNRGAKRCHISETCPQCQKGRNMYETTHPMYINGWSGHSFATNIPWREHPDAIPEDSQEWIDFTGDMRQWQMIR